MIVVLQKETFSDEVEKVYHSLGCELFEALLMMGEKYKIDEINIPKLMTPRLKQLAEIEARKKKLLKKNDIATLEL